MLSRHTDRSPPFNFAVVLLLMGEAKLKPFAAALGQPGAFHDQTLHAMQGPMLHAWVPPADTLQDQAAEPSRAPLCLVFLPVGWLSN